MSRSKTQLTIQLAVGKHTNPSAGRHAKKRLTNSLVQFCQPGLQCFFKVLATLLKKNSHRFSQIFAKKIAHTKKNPALRAGFDLIKKPLDLLKKTYFGRIFLLFFKGFPKFSALRAVC